MGRQQVDLVLRVSWVEHENATADDVWNAFHSILHGALKNGGWDVLERFPGLAIENDTFHLAEAGAALPSPAAAAALREWAEAVRVRIDALAEVFVQVPELMQPDVVPQPDDVVPQPDAAWPEPSMEPVQTFYDSDFVTVAVAAHWYRRLTPAGRAVLDLPETRHYAWHELSTDEAVRLMWKMVGMVGISKDLTYKLRDLAWEIVACAQNRAGGVGSDLEALEWEALRDLTQIFTRAPFPGPPPVAAPFYLNVEDRDEDEDDAEDIDPAPYID